MQRTQQGFTLIELMIVVAIIGILAAIAIPQYQDYVARSQIAEAPTLIDGAKTTVESFISQNGVFPSTASFNTLGIRESGKYVATIVPGNQDTSGGGTLTVTFRGTGVSPKIKGDTLVWQRSDAGVWTCGQQASAAASTVPVSLQPGTCH